MSELFETAKRKIKEFPQHKDDIADLYYMAVDEIADGGSEVHETELFNESVKEITEGVNA